MQPSGTGKSTLHGFLGLQKKAHAESLDRAINFSQMKIHDHHNEDNNNDHDDHGHIQQRLILLTLCHRTSTINMSGNNPNLPAPRP
jgi:ABC-type lipoprotein export system ATPase subunit